MTRAGLSFLVQLAAVAVVLSFVALMLSAAFSARGSLDNITGVHNASTEERK